MSLIIQTIQLFEHLRSIPGIRTPTFEIVILISTHESLGMRLDPPLVLDPLIHAALHLQLVPRSSDLCCS